MHKANPWQKAYRDMTPVQRKKKLEWNTYYKRRENIYNLSNAMWKDSNHFRALTLSVSKPMGLSQFNYKLQYLRRTLKKELGTDIFSTHIIVRAISPETGFYHAHISLFDVDTSISDTQYRGAITKVWKHGSCDFRQLSKNIYAWNEYVIKNISPDNPQMLREKGAVLITHSAVTLIPITTHVDTDISFDNKDVINRYKHKHSSSETILLRPGAQIQFIQLKE